MTAGVAVPIEALATLRRRLGHCLAVIRSAKLCCRQLPSFMRSAARHCIDCYATSGAPAARIALIVAPRASCRRPRSSAGARSSPP